MAETVLYDYWRSSASYRVRIALGLAGVDYCAVPVDLVAGDHKTPDHLARNPQGLVPVLEIDGLRLTQSLAIIDYLDETRDLELLPKEPGMRAQVRALAQSIAVDIHPVCNLSVVTHAAQLSGRAETREEWMVRFIRPGLQAFETLLGAWQPAPFCCGERPMLPDICLLPQVYNARRWGVEIDDLPRLISAVAPCEAHPAFARAHPDAVKPD
jgi:maleylacetoacetate isomerase